MTTSIITYDKNAFKKIKAACELASATLDYITPYVREGSSTLYLNDLCHEYIIQNKGWPAPLEVKFPKSICTSVNHIVCHGIPDERELKHGDIINIDVSLRLGEYYGDTSRMFVINKAAVKAQNLINVTYEAMHRGIDAVKPGATLGDIGHAIQSFVESNNFSIVKDYCGHGIGKSLHEYPPVLHYGKAGEGVQIVEGMCFTIEPMVNAGSEKTILSTHDDWTVTTSDKSLSAQFEHTVFVTATGVEVLT